MPSFAQLFTLATLVVASSAVSIQSAAVTHIATTANCINPTVSHSGSINVGNRTVHLTGLSCAPAQVSRRGLLNSPPLCYLFGDCAPPPPPPPAAPTNVCGQSCTTSCNNLAGVLPPISDDCQTIEDAIQIFQGQATTFTVDPNSLETLTFGTCNYWFANNESKKQLDYCWADVSIGASAAGSACFPPNQPFTSEGLCTSSDGSWSVGASHS